MCSAFNSSLNSLSGKNSIEMHLECSLCLQVFNDPRNLPCGHTFCLNCITNHVESNHGDSFCPICRLSVVIPSGGAKNFPKNYCIGSLILSNLHQPRICVLAAVDKERSHEGENWFCPECMDVLCDNCSRAHAWNKFTYSHVLKKTSEVSSAEWRSYDVVFHRKCHHHPQEVIFLFCRECRQTMCAKCVRNDVDGHMYLKLEDALETKKTNISSNNSRGNEDEKVSVSNAKVDCFDENKLESHENVSILNNITEVQPTLIIRGPYGGDGGVEFSDSAYERFGPITAMRIRSCARIDAIQFRYGLEWGPKHGGNGGSQIEIIFEPNEYIYQVMLSWKKTIHQILFVTNKRVLGPYGGNSGNFKEVNGNSLRYISGKAGREIDQLVFWF